MPFGLMMMMMISITVNMGKLIVTELRDVVYCLAASRLHGSEVRCMYRLEVL